jgi:paraquat-inducible protein B
MERHLNDETRFWVVTAHIAGGQVSGLGTLLGGAYVGMDPGRGQKRRREFQGLDAVPVVAADVPGRHFELHSHRAGLIAVGTPVFFRKIEVGRVVASELDPSGEFVRVRVFVREPHAVRVTRASRFWDVSGFDVDVSAAGVQIDTESVVSILIGGIAFDTPTDGAGVPADDGAVFTLYENYEATRRPVYQRRAYYLVHFEQSVRGLAVGAPVEFSGIVIGQVTDVKLEYDPVDMRFHIPVTIEIEPERIYNLDTQGTDGHVVFEKLVAEGLRAQIKSGNLLTGQLVVSLDMHPEAPPAQIVWSEPYPELPTVPTPIAEITTSLTQIAQRLEKIPFDQIGADLSGTLRQLNRDLAPALRATLVRTEGAVASVSALIGPESPVNDELRRVLVDLAEAARALELVADEIERQPQSLLFGKGKDKED